MVADLMVTTMARGQLRLSLNHMLDMELLSMPMAEVSAMFNPQPLDCPTQVSTMAKDLLNHMELLSIHMAMLLVM